MDESRGEKSTDVAAAPTPASGKRRDISIDSLRGLAVILMVAGHVVGSTGDAGMRVADDSAWRWFYLMLEDIRMPLFTVLSGFVYGMRPLRRASGFGALIKGKGRRLIVPLVVVGSVFYVSQVFLPGTNQAPPLREIWRVYLFGYGHFWFLLALFAIFILVPLLDAAGALATPGRWALVLAAAITAFLIVPRMTGFDVFAVFGTLRLLPFFLLGYGLNVHRDALRRPAMLLTAVVLALVGMVAKVWEVQGGYDGGTPWGKALAVDAGIGVLFTLMWFKDSCQLAWLAWLGQCSFGIYLLHVFGTAGARIFLARVGWDGQWVVFLVSLTTGILAPVAFELCFGRFRIVSWGVLGQKPKQLRLGNAA